MNNNIQANPNKLFKKSFLPQINQKSYQSYNLITGKIIKITKDNIYFDIGLKGIVKTGKKQFIKAFFPLDNLIYTKYSSNTQKYTFRKFLENVKIGKSYKFIVYQLNTTQTKFYIQFDKTAEYIQDRLFFYEFEQIKRKNDFLYGYVLNTVNGGFSVGINGLVAFVPNKQMITDSSMFMKQKTAINSAFKFKILNINFERKNIVLTRKTK
tara:strand:+ start:345 stop:974 length:630 start_codon:yes stop_codon:yes gene_type:complete